MMAQDMLLSSMEWVITSGNAKILGEIGLIKGTSASTRIQRSDI
jgi:hypothetical protein